MCQNLTAVDQWVSEIHRLSEATFVIKKKMKKKLVCYLKTAFRQKKNRVETEKLLDKYYPEKKLLRTKTLKKSKK